MSKTTKILYDNLTKQMDFFKTMPLPILKEKFTENKYYGNVRSIYEDDDKICYSNTNYRICFQKQIFPKTLNTKGMTYNKSTRKIHIWYGNTIKIFDMEALINILEHFNIKWILEYKEEIINNGFLSKILTKTLFEKIINGNINNLDELIDYYKRISLRCKGYDNNLLKEYLILTSKIGRFSYENITTFLIRLFKHTSNPNKSLSAYIELLRLTCDCKNILNKDRNSIVDDYPTLKDNVYIKQFLINDNRIRLVFNSLNSHICNLHRLLKLAYYLDVNVNLRWNTVKLNREMEMMRNEMGKIKIKNESMEILESIDCLEEFETF